MAKSLSLKERIMENGSYKVVSLFVALVLWVAILGRKDFELNHKVALKFQIPAYAKVSNRVTDQVRIRVSGPRLALKRFSDANSDLKIDLRGVGIGRTNLRIHEDDFVLPNGIRVLTISPSFLSIDIDEKPSETPVENATEGSETAEEAP